MRPRAKGTHTPLTIRPHARTPVPLRGSMWALVILQALSTGFKMLLLFVSDGTFRDFVSGLIILGVMTIRARLKAKRR